MVVFMKFDHNLFLVFLVDYHRLYWKCLAYYMNIQCHYLFLPTIYKWNVKNPRQITRLSRYSMKMYHTVFNRSRQYYRWKDKGCIEGVCNIFFVFYVYYIFNSKNPKKLEVNNFLLIQKQPPEVFCEKSFSIKFRKIHRKTTAP